MAAEPVLDAGYNTYGYPGLIDMPVALGRPDSELAFTSSYFRNQHRNTLAFQIGSRLSGSLRYANLNDIKDAPGETLVREFRFDRSFSLHYQIATETRTRPAVAVGLNDFLGTGVYQSEYFVASKTLGPRIRVTGGIGWGRLGRVGAFRNPLALLSDSFEDRAPRQDNQDGAVEVGNFFKGEAALFGGLEYQATDKLRLTLEYSSDDYPLEGESAFEYRTPFNFGASYRIRPNIDLSGHYLYGSEFGLQISMALNPKLSGAFAGGETAPPPVVPRAALDARALGWSNAPDRRKAQERRLAAALNRAGLGLHGLEVDGATAIVEIENENHVVQAQAVGRAARVLTGILPPDVDTFVIVPVVNGIAGAQVTLGRGDIEALEHAFDGSWQSYARARFDIAGGPVVPVEGLFPRFRYDLKPYLAPSLFDPENPVRADVGAELSALYEPAPGVLLKGVVRKKLAGNLGRSTRTSTSVLPRVRSDFSIYNRDGDPALTELTAAHFFRPGPDLYGRVTAGYLEPQFGGLSGEVLWKPIDRNYALGLELNYVRQRDFDQRFGFRDYEIATGHASAYYTFGNGIRGQLDVGRYLAGDWGATVAFDRTFANGWSVGAFATFTDVSFDEFGEGSFDKGIRITIPTGRISGEPTRAYFTNTIRPVTGDGGARLNVSGRLHGLVRDTHKPALRDGWGRFWR